MSGAVALAAALALAAAPVRAQLVTFDDLPLCAQAAPFPDPVPAAYAGFSWTGFGYGYGAGLAATLNGPGYANGVVSPGCVGYVQDFGFGDAVATITRGGQPFTFNGGYFTAAFDPNILVTISGWIGAGVPFYGYDLYTPGTATPQFVDVNWPDVTTVWIAVTGGPKGRQLVVDNLRFNNASVVPEPASVALTAAGLTALLAAAARRRRAGAS